MQSNSYRIEGLTSNDGESVNSRNKHKYVTRPKLNQEGYVAREDNEAGYSYENKSSRCKKCRKKK
jgi:hypothetical protein